MSLGLVKARFLAYGTRVGCQYVNDGRQVCGTVLCTLYL